MTDEQSQQSKEQTPRAYSEQYESLPQVEGGVEVQPTPGRQVEQPQQQVEQVQQGVESAEVASQVAPQQAISGEDMELIHAKKQLNVAMTQVSYR